MKYPYAVKYNGVFYSPNEEIPESTVAENAKVDEVVENSVEKVEKPKTRKKRGAAE